MNILIKALIAANIPYTIVMDEGNQHIHIDTYAITGGEEYGYDMYDLNEDDREGPINSTFNHQDIINEFINI